MHKLDSCFYIFHSVFYMVKLIVSIKPNELEVNDTNDTQKSASYLDLQLEIDNGGRLKTKLYDFPFIISNIPPSPAYVVNISQLIRNSRACDQYSDFLGRVSC